MVIVKDNKFLKIIIAMDNDDSQKTRTTSYVVIAIVAALGVLGVVVVVAVVTIPVQEAEAGCESGFPNSAPSVNASRGRCFRG